MTDNILKQRNLQVDNSLREAIVFIEQLLCSWVQGARGHVRVGAFVPSKVVGWLLHVATNIEQTSVNKQLFELFILGIQDNRPYMYSDPCDLMRQRRPVEYWCGLGASTPVHRQAHLNSR